MHVSRELMGQIIAELMKSEGNRTRSEESLIAHGSMEAFVIRSPCGQYIAGTQTDHRLNERVMACSERTTCDQPRGLSSATSELTFFFGESFLWVGLEHFS